MSNKPVPPAEADPDRPQAPAEEQPGTNAVEHEPDPKAEPIPDGDPKYVPRSPFTTGNS